MAQSEKNTIRHDLINKRDAMQSDIWTTNSKIIQRNVLCSKLYRDCDILLIYSDYHGEVGTLTIIEDALINNKAVYLPKVLENFNEARMEFYRIFSTNELIDGYKGIMEPIGNVERVFDYDKEKDKKLLMFVPGVAFDKSGYRLGYGKGYYDNYLKDKDAILKVGICFSMQIVDDLPVSSNDIKLDYLIDEKTKTGEINAIKYPGRQ